jgi:O-antigen ligase
VGRASGYDWRHSSGRIGREERRSLADAAELGRTDRALVLGMDSACVLAVAHVMCRARLLAVLVVLRLAIWRRRRVLLLLVVAAAAVALLLLVCAVIALTMALLAAVVVVARHDDYVWSRDV